MQVDILGSTSRAIVQLIEATETGDADACTMALRGLSRLPAPQRVTLAALSLASLHDDDAALVLDGVCTEAGMPMSDLAMPLEAARHWAKGATRNELKATVLASFEALTPDDQAAFLRHVQGGAT
jgi:hypothetical protein